NSSPRSTIKVTSSNQHIERASPMLPSSTENAHQQEQQSDQQKQLIQQRIQEVINESNSDNRSGVTSLPKFIEKY
ncbi:MAG: hypothetical protein ACJ72T_10480, partial [Nitrososphaeraceae archaeon]